MVGERWFKVLLQDDQVGYMYNLVTQDQQGHWKFQTTTHFLLPGSEAKTITKTLIFEPYGNLLKATYEDRQAQRLQQITLEPDPEPTASATLRAHLMPSNREVDLDWHFQLSDHLAFESWLHQQRPASGASYAVRNIDFERLSLHQRAYKVVEQNATGYLVALNAPQAATQTQLNHRYQATALNMAGLFNITPTSQSDALKLSSIRGKVEYLFELDTPLTDHQRLEALTLQLTPAVPEVLASPYTNLAGLTQSAAEPGSYLSETLKTPLSHSRIQQLVVQAQKNADDDLLGALVEVAHRQLNYVESQPAGSVISALNRGYGECTDFADLMTTMARAAGLPARNVYGLAYQDGRNPAFLFHAWNEVYFDDQWQAVDATWNQRRTDATHIPLSDSQFAHLMLAHTQRPVRIEVLEAQYAGDAR